MTQPAPRLTPAAAPGNHWQCRRLQDRALTSRWARSKSCPYGGRRLVCKCRLKLDALIGSLPMTYFFHLR